MSFASEPEFVPRYEDAVSMKEKKVLLIVGADWCRGCVRLKKSIDSINLKGYVVCFVDADERADICMSHSVSAYPTSLILFEGEEVSRNKGYEKRSYENWLKKFRYAAGKGKQVAK